MSEADEHQPIEAAVLADPVVQAVLASNTQIQGSTVTTPAGNVVASPTKTQEDERVSAGQRTVNLIWESTQMKIALSVIWASLIVSGALAVTGKLLGTPDIQLAAVVFLFGVANLVTGFYFGRTNHTKVGGIEPTR